MGSRLGWEARQRAGAQIARCQGVWTASLSLFLHPSCLLSLPIPSHPPPTPVSSEVTPELSGSLIPIIPKLRARMRVHELCQQG